MFRFSIVGTAIVGGMLAVGPTPAPGHDAIRAVEAAPSDSGTLTPVGPPVTGPTRTDAGASCIVDLTQGYSFTGALSGAAEIDYRILVRGPCGAPPGTYEEEWIAHGEFRGKVHGSSVVARFTYLARAHPGGRVEGRMVFGQGLGGEVEVLGNLSDGRLRYSGRLD